MTDEWEYGTIIALDSGNRYFVLARDDTVGDGERVQTYWVWSLDTDRDHVMRASKVVGDTWTTIPK